MLPAVGLLRTVPCPYYIAGLCDRPHCYFSHAKRDIEAVRNNSLNKKVKSTYDDTSVSDTEERSATTSSKIETQSSLPAFGVESVEKKSENNVSSVITSKRSLEKLLPHGLSKPPTESSNGIETIKRRYSEDLLKAEHKRPKLESIEVTKSLSAVKPESPVVQSKETKNTLKKSTIQGNCISVEGLDSVEQLSYESVSLSVSVSQKQTERNSQTEKKLRSPKEKSRTNEHKKNESSRSHHRSGHKSKSKTSSNSDRHYSRSNEKTGSSSSKHRSEKGHHKSHRNKRTNVDDNKKNKLVTPIKNRKDNIGPISESSSHDELFDFADIDSEFNHQEGSTISSEFLFPEDNDSDEDPTEIALECLEMFNSYKADETKNELPESNTGDMAFKSPASEKTFPDNSLGKKRVAHPGAEQYSAATYIAKPRFSPAELLQQRYHSAQQNNSEKSPPKCTNPTYMVPPPHKEKSLGVGRKRISHVANVSSLLKPKVPESSAVLAREQAPTPSTKVTSTTVVQTVQKGQSRVAHSSSHIRPKHSESPLISVQSVKNSKVPLATRQKILEQLFQECLKIYPNPKDSSERALMEEAELVARCSSKPVYMCAGTNSIARLRRELTQESVTNATALPPTATISHQSILCGSSGSRVSWSIENTKRTPSTLNGILIYQKIKKYILPSSELEINGYPRPDPNEEKGRAIAKQRTMGPLPIGKSNQDPFERTCERCKKIYRVKPDGFPVKEDQCVYHQGRKYSRRINGISEGYYSCCSGDMSTTGCAFAASHVSGNPTGELRGFVTVVQCSGSDDTMGKDPWDIVAIDCEMIYTTYGSELARATFIGCNLQVLYDQLVKPIHPIVDYNTRYSGITEEMLKNIKTTLTDVQAVMLTHLKPNSILIGHSLESDLIALKLIHHNVIDTAVMFPHKMGPPFKRALRNLSSEFIKKIIQEGEGGHDSAEDARTAMELVLWKLNEDKKIQDSSVGYVGRKKV